MPLADPYTTTKPPDTQIQLWYEDEGHRDGDPLLLIMGLGSQLIAWPQELVDDLVSRGFRVIRFDNRDCGLSTHLKHLTPCTLQQLLPVPYILAGMADDTENLLGQLLGNAQAHVVGASMGGMIAQLLTLNHPTRVKSLCSIMSTTGNLKVGQAEPGIIEKIMAPVPPPGGRDEAITHIAGILALIGSKTYPLTPEEARRQAAEAYDRAADNPSNDGRGTRRQSCAILVAVDRTDRLKDVKVPTLVIHGNEDPLINISGGQATAAAVPGAVLKEVSGMGHDLPEHLWTDIADYIEENAEKAGA